MITANCSMNNSTLSFKAGKPDNSQLYKEMEKLAESLNKPKEKIVKNSVPKAKIGSFLKNAGDVIKASGAIAGIFIWNRISALAMCLWTIPGIIAMVTGGTILFCRHYIDKHQYPKGHERYSIEKLDKKASEVESLYNKNPQKYYEKTSSTIFNYYDALSQIKKEEQALETKISGLKK